ncbi:MAG: 50S ribosomal protein L3 N(5)-glutamine methyltransferase [Pigmentiphaga sp.]|nr:50S ribosomal protein L3 N(5)-glutamine methyltransferase [Pigmentiphaga sp.]
MSNARYAALQTLRDWLRYAVTRFNRAGLVFGHGSDNAYDEAAYLLLHTLHLPADTLEPFLDARLLESEREALLAIIERRIRERLPAAYLTGEAWLRGRRFVVDRNVLVPRSPIAELLDHGLEPWIPDPDAVASVLDLCTGSACLAILAAEAFPAARVAGADLSPAALAVAERNVADHGLEDRIALYRGDLLSAVPPQTFDLILCNPPYVNSASMAALPAEYRHEPALGLDGGTDGMDLVRRILAQAPAFLAPHGVLVLEIGHERPHFEAAFPHLQPVWLETAATRDHILLLTREQLLAS